VRSEFEVEIRGQSQKSDVAWRSNLGEKKCNRGVAEDAEEDAEKWKEIEFTPRFSPRSPVPPRLHFAPGTRRFEFRFDGAWDFLPRMTSQRRT
jgi:hypothetical protein